MSEQTEPDHRRRAPRGRHARPGARCSATRTSTAPSPNTTPFTADFQDFITRIAWGDLWQRPGLARRERSMLTLAITVALRHWDEFALHVRAAVNNGLTDEEIAEVCQHAAIYAGVPAANHAFKVAGPILEELRQTETP